MITRLRASVCPETALEDRAGAPYVVTLDEAAVEASRHEAFAEALEAARGFGPGAAVWRNHDLSNPDGEGPLAEVVDG